MFFSWNNRIRYFIIYKYIILCIVVFTGCSDNFETETPQIKTIKNVPLNEIWDFTILLSKEGIQTAKVSAGHMVHFSDSLFYLLDDSVTVNFYNENGELTP